jgi:hypothetical protein
LWPNKRGTIILPQGDIPHIQDREIYRIYRIYRTGRFTGYPSNTWKNYVNIYELLVSEGDYFILKVTGPNSAFCELRIPPFYATSGTSGSHFPE